MMIKITLTSCLIFLLINLTSQIKEPPKLIKIIHFNDIYDIKELDNEPKAGAAYFKSMLDRYRDG